MSDITLDDVIEMLEGVRDDVDFESETNLIDGRVLDSFDILSIIGAIDDEFDIAVPPKEIIPANFNSAEGILAMVQRLEDAD